MLKVSNDAVKNLSWQNHAKSGQPKTISGKQLKVSPERRKQMSMYT
jgi:hypothetical protein